MGHHLRYSGTLSHWIIQVHYHIELRRYAPQDAMNLSERGPVSNLLRVFQSIHVS